MLTGSTTGSELQGINKSYSLTIIIKYSNHSHGIGARDCDCKLRLHPLQGPHCHLIQGPEVCLGRLCSGSLLFSAAIIPLLCLSLYSPILLRKHSTTVNTTLGKEPEKLKQLLVLFSFVDLPMGACPHTFLLIVITVFGTRPGMVA